MLVLLALVAVAGYTASTLYPLMYDFAMGFALAYGAVGVALCVLATFVATAMHAVASRDSAPCRNWFVPTAWICLVEPLARVQREPPLAGI